MTRRTRLTVAALTAASSSGHLLYPAWLALASRRRPTPVVVDPDEWPAITVLVAAYNESEVIGAKVRDVLANGYPGPLEVMVVADADLDTAERAEAAGATVVTADDRLGKSQALNLGMSKVTTPVVVMSDANNFLAPGALAAMVRYFTDPAVGAVAGEKVEAGGGGEDIYWRFESWLKQREWRLGTTIGLVGELAAIRTAAWRPIPADIASDDLWMALDLAARDYAIAYEPSAQAFEPPGLTMGQHWERRARVVAGGLHVLLHHRSQLGPRGGLMAVEAWGHRLVRYTVTPVAHVALLWMALHRVRTSRLARVFLLGHVVAARSLVRQARQDADPAGAGAPAHPADGGRPRPAAVVMADRAEKALGQAVFLHAVALKGIVRYLGGDRQTRWTMVRAGQDRRSS